MSDHEKWTRRALLGQSVLLGVGALAGTLLTSCSPGGGPGPVASSTPSRPGGGRTLLMYFSRPGENYYYGGRRDLAVGNTEVVAGLIADRIAIDVFRVQAADPYSSDYDATVQRNVQEEEADARPALAVPPPSVGDYDTVLLGSPVWNSRLPMIMRTLVERLDLSGKTVLPVVTYAVSGLGRVPSEYGELCPGATVGSGLAVRGEEALQSASQVEAWLRQVGLLDS